ncbi:hypothetical protein [Ekhidna sp.]|uniref:hypothetical protein n=1 Tax=Ekhidna sp. TaxID=2608089 RepID=UPI003B505346
MKSLLLLLMLSASGILGTAEATMRDNQGLNMQIDADLEFQQMVKIYSYEGELVKEFPLNDVANNKISVIDHIVLEESDFAFDHQGDYYYFRDAEGLPEMLN